MSNSQRNTSDKNSALTKDQQLEVDIRLDDHENGIGRTYTKQEVDKILDELIVNKSDLL